MYLVQQEDIDILFQKSKELYIKIQLLNKNYTVIEELKGVAIDGNVTITAESSSSRRSFSLSLSVVNSSFYIGDDKKIWIDKYLDVHIGVKNTRTQIVNYYPIGIYTFSDSNYSYDTISHVLDISCLDLISELDGTRNGALGKNEILIPAGSDIRGAMVSTVSQFGKVSKYIIHDIKKKTPQDLNFSVGSTVYDVICKLRDIYPAWETFFDTDGTFICQQIPTCIEDNIVLDNETIQKLLIRSSVNISFSDVKNTTEVFGASNKCDRYTDTSTNLGAQYNVSFNLFELKERMTIGFMTNTASQVGATIKINDLSPIPICDESGNGIVAKRLKANTSYVFRYKNQKFYLSGEFQVYAIAYDDNPESPFYVGVNKENVVLQVLQGGEYSVLWSDDLAFERAEYETWKAARLKDQISITTMLVPWLDVNQKILFKPAESETINQYIIKNVSFNLMTGTMDMTAMRFYPLYPKIVN